MRPALKAGLKLFAEERDSILDGFQSLAIAFESPASYHHARRSKDGEGVVSAWDTPLQRF
jgi:hypothetical protein